MVNYTKRWLAITNRKERMSTMPLSLAPKGSDQTVRQISGKLETRRFLESLGFVAGCSVTVVSELGGDLIVAVKDARVALSRSMANHIMVS